MGKTLRFSFGKNWQSYSQTALTPESVEQARQAFRELVNGIVLSHKRFIDIGFGQGLCLNLAAEMGADVLGIEIDEDNLAALHTTQQIMGNTLTPEVRIVSILEPSYIQANKGKFDIVHSWGVLHHTGNLRQAIQNACTLVAEGGYLICSIYNKHWSSPFWKIIKWTYNKLPAVLQRFVVGLFYPVIYTAKWLVTGKNPKKKERGMNFFHDVVDWVGGYPYEYATETEIRNLVEAEGFECLRFKHARVPTGCNEYVFHQNKPIHCTTVGLL
jgi:SAM-dependent methyltransferase